MNTMTGILLTATLEDEWQQVTKQASVFEKFFETLPEKALSLGIRIVLAILAFMIGAQIIKLVRKIVKKSMTKAKADVGVIQFTDSFVKVALYMLLVFLIAGSFGVDAASIVAVLGSAGVAIGLAIQGSLSNFAGGVLILLLKPFKVGDYIVEDNKGNEGTVTEIQLFYTKLTTYDNKVIILPNGTLANTSMTNVTEKAKRRLDVPVGVAYDTDLREAKRVLTGLLKEDPATLKKEEMFVYVDELGDSAVKLCLRCWVKQEDYWQTKWRLTERVKYTLDEAGISIPFPQIDVHQK